MTDISLLTIVRSGSPQLDNLLRGVADQKCAPQEMVLVFINEDIPTDLPDPGCKLYVHRLSSLEDEPPPAAARNRAAAEAKGAILAFLDVNCIPHPDYVSQLEAAVCLTQGLIMSDVRYLPEGAVDGNWKVATLRKTGMAHPRIPQIPPGKDLIDLDHSLFQSLAFGIRQEDFARVGGFDEKYRGYGGEDTDFALAAERAGLPFYGCKALVYQQYPPTNLLPYAHLPGLVLNANRFFQKWSKWPMEEWLKELRDAGYIDWGKNEITILRQADTPFG